MSPRIRRRATAALYLSLAAHLCAAVAFNLYKTPAKPPVVIVTAGRIMLERKPKPPKPPPPPPPAPAHARAHTFAAARPEAAPRIEEAHITPHALVYQPKHSRTNARSRVQLPQVDYEKTIAQLRQANNPLTGTQSAVDSAARTKRYSTDFSRSIGAASAGEGYLEVVQSWHDDGYDYYRVHYEVLYPDGTSESGIVPWPIRYLPQIDPFRLGIHHMPLPAPLPDFALPPGTVLHPLVAFCFKHRAELESCPIQHD
ncbi:MAG: hypothetical protein ABR508_04140 [Candidatus Baltobacteraceae bacterium]